MPYRMAFNEFEDLMDDDGKVTRDIHIKVKLCISNDRATLDFSDAHAQVGGSINAV